MLLLVIGRLNFNPRSLAGATSNVFLNGGVFVFQSTLPCGSDYCYNPYAETDFNFNPRSLAGATRYEEQQKEYSKI